MPVYTPFLQFLRNLWKPKGAITLLLHGNGFFTVKFGSEEDLLAVLEGGPWTMAHRPFIIKKWSPDLRMEQERLTSIPVWVRLPNLPMHLWDSESLGRIGSLLGNPLFMDTATERGSRGTYARICVEVEATTKLPDSVLVDVAPGLRERFKVDYDWKPTACKHCHTFGHDEERCCKKPSPAAETQPHPQPRQSKGKEKVSLTLGTEERFQSPKRATTKLMAAAIKATQTHNRMPGLSNKFDSLQSEEEIVNQIENLETTTCSNTSARGTQPSEVPSTGAQRGLLQSLEATTTLSKEDLNISKETPPSPGQDLSATEVTNVPLPPTTQAENTSFPMKEVPSDGTAPGEHYPSGQLSVELSLASSLVAPGPRKQGIKAFSSSQELLKLHKKSKKERKLIKQAKTVADSEAVRTLPPKKGITL
ncbi:hypothetical protein QJS10_CPA06g01720 [Acorus calamus]|uniref:DUF4283 domain-containing protein n=1 Tax=Acorus calamus TaxID=4465 RepID=A0AAV9EM27_ACOCL|nr:hypothetical protein QJS10_CPA06g01720 [Acorus calamus]